VGESYDDDDVPADGDGLWGDGDEGGDGYGGRGSPRGDLYASPGWAHGHETGDRGCGHGDADSDTHAYADDSCHSWDGHTVRPSGHCYDRVDDGGRAANQRLREEH